MLLLLLIKVATAFVALACHIQFYFLIIDTIAVITIIIIIYTRVTWLVTVNVSERSGVSARSISLVSVGEHNVPLQLF